MAGAFCCPLTLTVSPWERDRDGSLCRTVTLISLFPWEREQRRRACSNSECRAKATCRPARLRHSHPGSESGAGSGGNPECWKNRKAGKNRRRWIPAFAGMTTACGDDDCVRGSDGLRARLVFGWHAAARRAAATRSRVSTRHRVRRPECPYRPDGGIEIEALQERSRGGRAGRTSTRSRRRRSPSRAHRAGDRRTSAGPAGPRS